MSYNKFAHGFRRFLNHPARVLLACMGVFAISIVLNGNIWRLWGLHRDYDHVTHEILVSRENITNLSSQLKQAKDPSYIERQARDRLDLASENDLVFVFSDQ